MRVHAADLASYIDHQPFPIWRPKWFLLTRCAAVVGVAIALVVSRYLIGITDISYGTLWLLDGILLGSNGLYYLYYRYSRSRETGDTAISNMCLSRLTKVQISADLVILTFMLHFAGGATNPFILYYFFHIILSSILLSRRWAFMEATTASLLFDGMVLLEGFGVIGRYEVLFPGFDPTPVFMGAMCFAMTSALYIAAYMATSIMDSLRLQQYELERSLKEIRRLEEEKSKFLSVVSHDLKEPIAAIETLASAALAVHGGAMPVKAREAIERIPVRTGDLMRLIHDLLEFSRITTYNQIMTPFKPMNLLPVVTSVVEMYLSQAEEKNITVSVQSEPELPRIRGNADLLERMAGNLLSNAIRYTPAGGSVTVQVSKAPGEVVLMVADTGIGIPREDLPRVFTEFFRAENAKRFTSSGTGLGMAIVKAVVDQHHGSISVKSEVGEGTGVTVRFPTVE